MKLHNLFSLLLFAALSFALSACAQTEPVPSAPVLTPAPDPVANWIAAQALNHPWLTAVAAVMGFLRMVFKPLMSAVHVYIAETATDEDNKLVARVEQSPWFKVLAYALDWAGSIKLAKPTNYIPTQLICAALVLGFATTGCQSLSDSQRAALVDAGKLAAKVALQLGLGELGQRVNELQPYTQRLGLIIETTFSQAEAPEAIASLLKARVTNEVPAEHRAAVLAQLRRSAENLPPDPPAPAATAANRQPATGNRQFGTRLAAALQ